MVSIFRLFLCITCFSNAFAQDKLIFAIDIVRHGDRTPLYDIPTIPYAFSEKPGQLTAKGLMQEYALGQQLRQRYIKEEQLLPENYQSNVLYARSTDFDRTLMSAQALLMGLYPLGMGPYDPISKKFALPAGYQPIPIHVVPVTEDDLVPSQSISEFLLNKLIYSQQAWKTKHHQSGDRFAEWSKITGISIDNLRQLTAIGDTLYVYQQHDLPLPSDYKPQEVNSMIKTGKWVLVELFKPKEIGCIHAIKLLTYLNQYLQQAKPTSTLKYVLLMGHDSTFLSLLSALQIPAQDVPSYASILNFSLFETSAHQLKIKVHFNNTVQVIPECSGNSCSLEEFQQLVETAKVIREQALTVKG